VLILLNSHWRIKSDPLQWIVEERDSGESRKWRARAFCNTLDYAVLWAAQRQIRLMRVTVGPEALDVLCRSLDELKAEVKEAVGGLRVEHLAAE
jgi:hypothetical protein